MLAIVYLPLCRYSPLSVVVVGKCLPFAFCARCACTTWGTGGRLPFTAQPCIMHECARSWVEQRCVVSAADVGLPAIQPHGWRERGTCRRHSLHLNMFNNVKCSTFQFIFVFFFRFVWRWKLWNIYLFIELSVIGMEIICVSEKRALDRRWICVFIWDWIKYVLRFHLVFFLCFSIFFCVCFVFVCGSCNCSEQPLSADRFAP